VAPGSGSVPLNWFDRLGEPTAGRAAAASGTTETSSGWAWSPAPWDTAKPGAASESASSVVPAGPVVPDAGGAVPPDDDDDDWPTRYSWLDDDETDLAGPSGGAVDESGAAGGKVSSTAAKPAEADEAAGDATAAAGKVPPEEAAPATATETADSATTEPKTAEPRVTDPRTTDPRTTDPRTTVPKVMDLKSEWYTVAPEPGPKAQAGESGEASAAFTGETAAELPAEADRPGRSARRDQPEPAAKAGEPEPSAGAGKPEPAAKADAAPTATADSDGGDPAADKPAESGTVSVLSGVPRYHLRDCVLIRFMPDGDVRQLTIPEAQAAGCTPCTACEPTG
jgi:hypothetical protein